MIDFVKEPNDSGDVELQRPIVRIAKPGEFPTGPDLNPALAKAVREQRERYIAIAIEEGYPIPEHVLENARKEGLRVPERPKHAQAPPSQPEGS